MFSNRSVSVQPSAPPIEYAGVPEARSVFAAARNCGHVFGGCDAGVLERRDVVPDGRLVGALEEEAVELAVDRAELRPHRARSSLAIVGLRERDRLQRALVCELLDRGPAARSSPCPAGCRPATAVASTVGMLSPRRRVLDLDARVHLLEPVDHGLERLLLVAGPDRRSPRSCRTPRSSLRSLPAPRRRRHDRRLRPGSARRRQRRASTRVVSHSAPFEFDPW